MGLPNIASRITPQEYYRRERVAVEKSDYYQGRVYAMAGGGTRHSIIKVNLVGELRRLLKGRRCGAFDSDQRIRAKWNGLRCYPDASVICGPIEYDDEDDQKETATNPSAVFEVLSQHTESYDRGRKAEAYRGIESLRAYILIMQERPHVEIQERLDDGTWRLRWVSGLDAVISLPQIEMDLAMTELYERVSFEEEG